MLAIIRPVDERIMYMSPLLPERRFYYE